eukprot:Sspe_Gene.2623::Locus_878_Transcript_1_1_Confidence_1.000_Length_838::g.2623::m.2623/K01307/GGH; gamma-glutamyl hydrolase
MAGGQVVPIHYTSSEEELKAIFGKINGVLFPGGGADVGMGSRYNKAGGILYKLAVEANDRGDVFPIWGTCLGLQLMMVLTAQDTGVLCGKCYDTEGVPLPLDFTPTYSDSVLFSNTTFPPQLHHALATENITENSHHDGVDPRTMPPSLKRFYNVLSTNTAPNGKQFVSTIEAYKYPFAATQWHPEKANFEFLEPLGPKAFPHSENAVRASQYVANYFVGLARKSSHSFGSKAEESKSLIYNYQPRKDPNGYFELVYSFTEQL